MDRVRYYETGFIQFELIRPGTEFFFEQHPPEIRAGVAYKMLADNTNLLPLFNSHLNRLSREYARFNRVFLDNRRELPPLAPAIPGIESPAQ